MSTWKNKHLLIATLLAPVLALIAYFGVNAMLGETPHAAKAGQSYQLVEKPNCRYSGGNCGLKNGDFELSLSYVRLEDGRILLKLGSVHPLDGVMLALVENEAGDERPVAMQSTDSGGLNWFLDIAHPNPERHRLHLVASANRVLYFGDASTKFTLMKVE